jgi:hypothetical protein
VKRVRKFDVILVLGASRSRSTSKLLLFDNGSPILDHGTTSLYLDKIDIRPNEHEHEHQHEQSLLTCRATSGPHAKQATLALLSNPAHPGSLRQHAAVVAQHPGQAANAATCSNMQQG